MNDDRENATLYETVLAHWDWIGSDLDSQTRYKILMAKQFGVSIAEVERAMAEVKQIKSND